MHKDKCLEMHNSVIQCIPVYYLKKAWSCFHAILDHYTVIQFINFSMSNYLASLLNYPPF